MSFLKIGDRAAGAIKSGGTTRRAAKMVILDLDHPDIETFIEWKAIEEDKARALIAAGYPADFNGEAYATVSGQNSNNSVRVPTEFLKAIEEDGDWELTARTDGSVMKTVKPVTYGTKLLMQHGSVQILEFNMTQLLMNGTPPLWVEKFVHQIHAQNIYS